MMTPELERVPRHQNCHHRHDIDMTIKLKEETRLRLIGSIQRYFSENMDEPVGDLKASLLLDFCIKEIGPSIYNQAILDAQSHLQDKVAELDGECHETEFCYWRK